MSETKIILLSLLESVRLIILVTADLSEGGEKGNQPIALVS